MNRIQPRRIDSNHIKPDVPAIILSMILEVKFSCFNYLLLFAEIKLAGKHLKWHGRKKLHFHKDQSLPFFGHNVYLAAALPVVPGQYRVAVSAEVFHSAVFSATANLSR